MEHIQALIEERIDSMMNDVMVALRAAAIAALSEALGGRGTVNGADSQQPRKSARRRSSNVKPSRSKEEIAELGDCLYRQIDAAPGQSMSFYAKELGVTSPQLAVPARRLKKTARVRTVGQRNETKYFPMGPK